VALPSSPNSLSINQIAGEFGGSTPHSLSEYYAGGDNVASGIQGDSGAIPSSGAISIGQFYGSANRISIALTISSNTNNYQISQNRGGTYSSGITDIVLTNNAQVGSNAVGTAALATGASPNWATGDTITIVNNGAFRGRGGDGGGGMTSAGASVQAGQAAGDSIEINYPVTVQNTAPGDIYAGGGGGGGGARGSSVQPGQPGNPGNPPSGGKSPSPGQPGQPGNPPSTQFFGGGGGGGGAGHQAGSGGAGRNSQGQAGQAGSANLTSGGAGGNSTGQTNPNGGAGGANGAAGGQGTGTSDGAGGAAGKAIEPNGNQLTLNNSGQVIGATS